MKEKFFNEIKKDLSLNLDENQKKAVAHKNGPCLVLAVPGAGKTTVLISRISYLVNCLNINTSKILSITFSRASANDMRDRFDSIYGNFYGISASFSTIHSFCFMVLKDYFRKMNLNYSLIEGIKGNNKSKILKSLHLDINNFSISEDKLEELSNRIGYVKNKLLSPDDINCNNIKNFSKIFYAYENYKEKNRLLDFDDMLFKALYALENDKEILSKYKNKYEYIQVDEAQDTSDIQHKIIEVLAYPKNNIFIVADDDQSIYGFRGASPDYLLNFSSNFPNAKIIHMNKNYRSSETIVNISNNFIKQNSKRYKKNLIANNSVKSNIKFEYFKYQEEQYEFIIKNLNLNELCDTAILFRNNLSSIPLIDKFDRMDIDFYVKEAKLNFFNHWILDDILSFLNLVMDNSDKKSFEKVYYKMNAFISKKAMSFVLNSNSNDSVFKILESFGDLKSFQKININSLGLNFSKLSKLKTSEVLDYIENDLDYMNYLERRAEYLGQSLDNIMSYFSIIKILGNRTNSILDFIERISELKNIFLNSEIKKGIFISTVHSAKGLEFKNVFIVDLVNGEFPSSSSLDIQKKGIIDEIEEERRIFYVGITRAKQNLYLLSYMNSGSSLVLASDFFNDVKSYLKKENNLKKYNKNVEHLLFGNGTVLMEEDDFITIKFSDNKIRSFSKTLLKKNNLIKN